MHGGQRLLRAATQSWRRPCKTSRLSPLPQAGRGMRHGLALHPRDACRQGPETRCGRLQAAAAPSDLPRSHDEGRRRRGVRFGEQSPLCSRTSWRPYHHPTEAWPANRQAGPRPLPADDAGEIQRQRLSSASPSRDRDVDDQTTTRNPRPRKNLSQPVPRSTAHGPHPQHHDSLAGRVFDRACQEPLLSPTQAFIVAKYDAWNRLTQLLETSGGVTHKSYYDGLHRRIQKRNQSSPTTVTAYFDYFYNERCSDKEPAANLPHVGPREAHVARMSIKRPMR